ncbi:MAG: PIG-L deacetylase family protein [Anaerolineales bacterium]|jgi:LmbE family N-acetylglucosaminyl deacetylase
MDWIYLSPHLDDAAYSCGGLIWMQSQSDQNVSIWTVFAGDSPGGSFSPFAETIIKRWGLMDNPSKFRRNEDIRSCQILGAEWFHFDFPDAIYRIIPHNEATTNNSSMNFLYPDEAALFGPVNQKESQLVGLIADQLMTELKEKHSMDEFFFNKVQLVCPMGLGNHVDHQWSRIAAESLGLPLLYYADFPYAQYALDELHRMTRSEWKKMLFRISQSGLTAWQNAIEAHQSQLNTFWSDKKEMQKNVSKYLEVMGGIPLWGSI